jgi:hypothetical protein
MSQLSPAERTLRAKLAAHTKWATHDPVEGTAAARAAFLDRFDAQVDPSITDPAERARRAASLRKAYFARLALASARARRREVA